MDATGAAGPARTRTKHGQWHGAPWRSASWVGVSGGDGPHANFGSGAQESPAPMNVSSGPLHTQGGRRPQFRLAYTPGDRARPKTAALGYFKQNRPTRRCPFAQGEPSPVCGHEPAGGRLSGGFRRRPPVSGCLQCLAGTLLGTAGRPAAGRAGRQRRRRTALPACLPPPPPHPTPPPTPHPRGAEKAPKRLPEVALARANRDEASLHLVWVGTQDLLAHESSGGEVSPTPGLRRATTPPRAEVGGGALHLAWRPTGGVTTSPEGPGGDHLYREGSRGEIISPAHLRPWPGSLIKSRESLRRLNWDPWGGCLRTGTTSGA